MLNLANRVLLALALLPAAAGAQTSMSKAYADTTQNHQADEAAIQKLMDQFHQALAAHDGTALSGLFLPDANIWLNVLTDAAYNRAQMKGSHAPKIRVSNYQDFAKFVSTTNKNLDPVHSNVTIHTDGTIAAVYFDFVFNIDGKPENRGSETWQLVKASEGWRIAAISYSSEPVAQP
jgi:ketosteroid isomerase-like protein